MGCGGATERWAELVRLDRPDAVLLLPTPGAEARDLGDGVRRGPCDPTYDLWHREQLRAAVDVLGSSGAVVVLATTASTGDAAADERAGCLDRIADEVTRGFPSELLEVTGADRSAPAATARWMIGELARLTGLEALPFVVVVGDSQALRLVEHAPAFNELDLRVGNLGALGCGLSTQAVVMDGRDVDKSACASTLDGLAGDLATLHPDAVVVHAGVWEALDQSTTDGRIAYPDPRWEARLRANVAATVARLADDHELIALTTPCFAEGTARDVLGTPDLDARLARYNEVLAGEVERAGGTVVDLADRLCPGGEAVREVDGAEVRPDGVHLDRAGARAVWPWLAEQLRTAVRTAAADPGAIRSDS